MERSTSELAKELNLPESTIRTWVREYRLATFKKAGKLRFKNEAIEAIKAIGKLRSEGRTSDTIRKCLNGSEEARGEIAFTKGFAESSEIEAIVKKVISEESSLAEKYARATYTIGQLEERIKGLEVKVKLLEAPKWGWWYKLFWKKF